MSSNSEILLVEDDNDIREAIREVLETMGFGVREARNGEEGLAQLSRMNPALCVIVLDLMMPVMDGIGFLKGLHAQHGKDLAKRVLVTSADRSARSKVAEYGVADVLTKPFDFDAFVTRVRALCGPGPAEA